MSSWPRHPRNSRRRRDTAAKAARLAPPEERTPAPAQTSGVDDTIRIEADALRPPKEFLEDGERETGVFRVSPVVGVTVAVFLGYTLFVA